MNALVQILGIAYDGKSSFMNGTAMAPGRIREELLSGAYNPYAESLTPVLHPGNSVFAGIINPKAYDEIDLLLKRTALAGRPLFLGGDHSISYPLIRYMQSVYGTFHVLHFDAHGDLYDELEGDRYSHACPFARVLEDGLVLSLTQVGLRTLTPQQQSLAGRHSVHIVTMRELASFRPEHLKGPLYISLDIDVFDPGYAPGVSHRESGGLDPRTFINWLHMLNVPIIGADLVEYNPLRDPSGITASLCYKMVKEILDAMLRNPP